jgi:type II secretory ATPase GspE/PulE/Tfp pilus assembly ATPase PilB-like protein
MTKKINRPIDVAQAKATNFGYEFVNLSELRLTDDVISAVPRHLAKRYRAIPVAKQEKVIAVALADPSDLDVVDTLQRLLNTDIELRVATDEDIDAALNKYYE